MSTKGRVGWRMVVLLSLLASNAGAKDAPLVDAVKKGDKQAVRAALVTKSADVNVPTADGTTALHWAVHLDDVEMVDILLRAGADVKAANRYGVKALSLASENGNAATIKRLLEAGADPNTSLSEGETALMTAARAGRADALKLLLAHGADVNARDTNRGQTALMWAASQNNTEAIRTLIAAGADVQARTPSRAPEQADRPSSTAPSGVEQTSVFSAPPPTSFTPLMFAIRAGHLDAVRVLLEAGANVNETLSDGTSTLVVATANAHWELADFLLGQGADPNLAGSGWNALHQVVRTRRPNIGYAPGPIPTGNLDSMNVIKKMIARGVNINARMTKNGMKDGQRNRVNRLGATAFFLAAKNTDVEAMRVLVAAGANASIPTADNTTPLMVAAGIGIWNPGEDGGSLPGQEAEVLEAVKMCVESGNDVNAANHEGLTALHGAAFRGVNTVVEFLNEKGARLEARDKRGWTPLAIAAGLSYSDFYHSQEHTAVLLRQLMQARGLSTEGQVVDPSVCMDCLQTRPEQAAAVVARDKKMEAQFAARENVPDK